MGGTLIFSSTCTYIAIKGFCEKYLLSLHQLLIRVDCSSHRLFLVRNCSCDNLFLEEESCSVVDGISV